MNMYGLGIGTCVLVPFAPTGSNVPNKKYLDPLLHDNNNHSDNDTHEHDNNENHKTNSGNENNTP